MKILAIRGENLASLGSPFEIDFESGPLAGTGLFAITGETGSGKSTILDALCLALYGLYPRFSETPQQDALPDPSGTRPSIMDGGTILRRGSGNGHAEVEFIGQDGQRYRARWEARRARNKPDGTVQPAQRSLKRIDGTVLHQIATSKTGVQRAVDLQTGLSFEQFCRTVLLPQGQFDAFLLAQKAERGALLEKITGTEIYGRISRIVFERTRNLRIEAESLETQLTNLGILPLDERIASEERIRVLDQEAKTKTASQASLRERITQLENLEVAQSRLTEADRALELALNNSANTQEDRTNLAFGLSVQPLRPLRDRFSELARKERPQEDEVTAAHDELEHAVTDDDAAKERVSTAQSTHEKAEQDFKEFGPVWTEATRLDTELVTAISEANSAGVADTDARQALEKADQYLGEITRQLGSAETELRSSKAKLQEHANHVSLADQITNIRLLFERYHSGVAEVASLQLQVENSATTIAELTNSLANLQAQVATESDLQRAASQTLRGLQDELTAEDEGKWKTEESTLLALHGQNRELEVLDGRRLQSVRKRAEAQAAISEAKKTFDNASTRVSNAESSKAELEAQRRGVQHSVELAEATLEEHSAYIRSLLVDGQACPVCGAREHPYSASDPEDSLSKLAEDLRNLRSSLDKNIEQAGVEILRGSTDRSDAEATSRNAKRDQTDAGIELHTINQEFVTLRAAMETPCSEFGLLTLLPTALDEDVPPSSLLLQLRLAIEARRSVVGGRLTTIIALRRRVDGASKESQDIQVRLNAAMDGRNEANRELQQAQIEETRASGAFTQAVMRISEIEQDLAPHVSAAELSVEDLRKNAPESLAVINAFAQDVLDCRTAEANSTSQVNELSGQHKEQTAIHKGLAERAQAAAQNLQARNRAKETASEARTRLLDGEATQNHRTRFNKARIDANKELQVATEEKGRLAASRAAAHQREKIASAALLQLRAEIATAHTAYLNECDAKSIAEVVADELLAIPASETEALRVRINAIDRAIHEAEHTVRERKGVVQGFSSIEQDQSDRATLSTALSELTVELDSSREEIGTHKGRLAQDDELRLTAVTLRQNADETASVLDIWQQVENAIGSSTGDRFRTFAQSITLEHLVELANDHLTNFSGRYQLARSSGSDLALHVVDSDMGEEHRSVRSLSGGERFLVSLSLALSLSGLEGHDFTVDTLFIDEGFGSLDEETLEMAITALETLHGRGRKVGVITHVATMIENIPVQVKVEKLGAGSSVVRLQTVA